MSELTIVKVGTGAISNQERTELDREAISDIGLDIARIENHMYIEDIGHKKPRRNETEGSLVLVSSGAVTAGKEKLRLNRQKFNDVRMQQVAAMTGNVALCTAWEEATGMIVAQDLPTHNDLRDVEHWDNLAGAIATALKFGMLPVLNEGDARSTEELEKRVRGNRGEFKRFSDNDQLAARLAIQLGRFALAFADPHERQETRVIFVTDVEGVREDPAREDSVIRDLNADDINQIILGSVGADGEGSGGMLSKLLAAKDLAAEGIPVTIGGGKYEGMLIDLYWQEAGTHIIPAAGP